MTHDEHVRLSDTELQRIRRGYVYGKLGNHPTRYDPEWIQKFIGDPCDEWEYYIAAYYMGKASDQIAKAMEQSFQNMKDAAIFTGLAVGGYLKAAAPITFDHRSDEYVVPKRHTLRADQQAASDELLRQLTMGGDLTFTGAIGGGKTAVIGDALKRLNKRTAWVFRYSELKKQTIRILAKMGVDNVHFLQVQRTSDMLSLKGYEQVVLSECLRDMNIDHPNVLRIK